MINRQNYHDTRDFLAYLAEVKQCDPKTIERVRIYLNNLLIWADEVRLSDAGQIRPVFPAWLTEKKLSKASLEQNGIRVRQFYDWAKTFYDEYRQVGDIWIQTLRPARSQGMQSQQKTHVFYTLEEVRKIVSIPDHNELGLIRGKAAAALLYLSAIRADAFCTLPISSIDLDRLTVKQFPEMGVRTKFHKAGETYLLNIPDLVEVARRWDAIIRTTLPPDAAWFAKLQRGDKITSLSCSQGAVQPKRSRILEDDIKRLCALAGVEYKSPHKFRHGHAVYGIKHARNMKELKAVSQNMMHASVTITDGLYGNLNGEDIRSTIAGLGIDQPGPEDLQALIRVLGMIKDNPQLLAALGKC